LAKNYRIIQQWDHWLAQLLGTRVLEAEQKLLIRLLVERYGKHALLIGVPEQHVLLQASVMPHQVVISPLINKNKSIQVVEGDFSHLPITPGSVDLVVLPHTMEFIDNPHQLLVEACRIVKPEGEIIIMGFNPISLWGLKKYLVKNKGLPWSGHFLPISKIKNWLKLADFELVQQDMLLFRPPIAQQKIYQKLEFLEWIGSKCFIPWGGLYVLTAKAKVIPLTPIKLRWQQKLKAISATIPGPSMRDMK
jgi:SAM-dependent methyltransferase